MPTLENLTTVLEAFIGREMPERFILLGHSLGGWLAARYALRHPERLERLILVNTAGIFYPGVEKQRELFLLREPPDALNLLTTMWYRYPLILRPFTPFVFHDLRRRRVPELVNAVRREEMLNDSLHALRMPVDLIWGMEDRLIDRQVLEVFRSEVPQACIHTIDRCGHIPQLERPDAFVTLLQTILGPR